MFISGLQCYDLSFPGAGQCRPHLMLMHFSLCRHSPNASLTPKPPSGEWQQPCIRRVIWVFLTGSCIHGAISRENTKYLIGHSVEDNFQNLNYQSTHEAVQLRYKNQHRSKGPEFKRNVRGHHQPSKKLHLSYITAPLGSDFCDPMCLRKNSY